MIYFDSSYIIKCYIQEPGARYVRKLAEQSPVASVQLARVEFWSGVKRQVREKQITETEAIKVYEFMRQDESRGSWHWFPVTPGLLERVCVTLENLPASTYLRSTDALHLACAREHGFTEIYSNDKHLLAAASLFGLTAKNIIP